MSRVGSKHDAQVKTLEHGPHQIFYLVYGLALFLWQAVFDCLQVRHWALCNSKEELTGQAPQDGRVSTPALRAEGLHTPSCPEIKRHGIIQRKGEGA